MSLAVEIAFKLNGSPVRVSIPATMTALSMLRDQLNVTGTKYGCGEGECGACTILVDGLSVNSCLMFAVECDGRELTTVEGVAANPVNDRLRDALVEHGGVQCGFCTPGMVVQSTWLLGKHPHLDRHQVERGLEGNLCRCTGYKKIVDAVCGAGGSNE